MWCFRSRRDSNEPIPNAPDYPFATSPIANAKYIPIRLTAGERKSQRLMRGIMLASSYTDKVDILLEKTKRSHLIVKELTNTLTGFLTALSIENGAQLTRTKEKDFEPFKKQIIECVEVCRRYKIMNPDLLRTDYVKFLYMLQDAGSPLMREILGFEVTSPILTVSDYLEKRGLLDLLNDSELPLCITPVPKFQRKDQMNAALRRKDMTVDRLCKRYAQAKNLKVEEVETAVRSLNDANNFAQNNSESAGHLIALLKEFFAPDNFDDLTNLGISEGEDGARLTHEHGKQFLYVLQSLSLWKNISREMFALWVVAESDLLNSDNSYELRETGQGLHRVQKAPNLYAAVAKVLEETKRELGQWVGLETIHLGDNQVPNAFNFIDKYGQITRIVIPIIRTIENIDKLVEDDKKAEYIREIYGTPRNAKIAVLRDFFRHGFDGSGGDTMEDAGSCVDGRLTSAWNWCNNIRSKPFYPLFLMAGFTSFDGDLSM